MSLPLGARAGQIPLLLPPLLLMLAWLASLLSGLRADSDVLQDDLAQKLSRPNILLLVADDLGYNDTDALGDQGLSTPSITEIADQGVRFSRHYAHATCSPSRVALLTGRYAERFGFRHGGMEIPPEVTTLPEALRHAGYRTHLVGKWHAGEMRDQSLPLQQGFDTFFGFLNQWALSGEAEVAVQMRRPRYHNPWLRDGPRTPVQHQGHLTDILRDKSRELIRAGADSDKPWFIYHGFLAPHAPVQAASRFTRQYPDTPEGRYRALVAQLDDTVAKLLETLSQTGQDDNTLVIFLSDNGGTNTERDNNFPFYGRKNETYEGSVRTPLLMRFPKRWLAGLDVTQTVMNTDIYPTIMALLGWTTKEVFDGQSLLPLLQGEHIRRDAISWEQYQWNTDALSYTVLSDDGHWRLSSMFGLKPALYHLEKRASGDRDVAADFPERVVELRRQYRKRQWDTARISPQEHREGDTTYYGGWDLQRTPLHYGFTLGLAFGQDIFDPTQTSSHLLARQENIWSLHYDKHDGLQLAMGDVTLHGGNLNDNEICQPIVISANYQPAALVAPIPESYRLKLYVGNQLRDVSTKVPSDMARRVDQSANPTIVYHAGRAVFSTLPVASSTEVYNPTGVAQQHIALFKRARDQGELEYASIDAVMEHLCDE